MGGPDAYILTPSRLTEADKAEVRRIALAKANDGDLDQFWIGEWPLGVSFGPSYPDELNEPEFRDLSRLLGWAPLDVVIAFAYVGSAQASHVALAELCVEICECVSGIVDFGGRLQLDVESAPDRRIHLLGGTVYVVAGCHYGDSAFLRAWSQHPDFRMIK